MIRKVSFAALAVLVGTSAGAAADNRIRSQVYDPDQIVRILGRAGIQSTIEFAPDERIENVAVGDSSAWQITPNRRASLLFVKPLNARSRTNMTVVTDRRTYMFDLVAGDKWTTPVYALKFSYPNDKPPQMAANSAQPAVTAPVPAPAPATLAADSLHFDWGTKGFAKLLPVRVFDDGNSVYMAWRKDTPLPAILTVSEDSKEGPVSYRMSGEYIVVTPVPQNLVLRYGNKSAVLWPTRRIAPPPASRPSAIAQRMAANFPPQGVAAPIRPPVSQPAPVSMAPPQPAPADAAGSAVKLANMTSLFTDKLTDGPQ